MKLRTELQIKKAPFSITHRDGVVAIGSCFAEHMGQRLQDNKFNALVNPFGTLFNPLSISKAITDSLKQTSPDRSGFIVRDGMHLHYDYHSDLRAEAEADLKALIVQKNTETAAQLLKSKVLILTLGTSFVHRYNNTVVANCHRQPAKLFSKKLLSIGEMAGSLRELISQLLKQNQNLKIIMTVSPVRHTREGLSENMLSKAQLRVVVEQMAQSFPEFIHYFPAFELMLDDLRDYRFYNDDLIHPNSQALEYVWEKFQACYFSEETISLCKQWGSISQGLNHRAFNPSSKEHQSFLKKLKVDLQNLSDKLPVADELQKIHSQILSD